MFVPNISDYVKDIKCALQNKCYYSALSLTLTLPDMCGMAEFPKKQVGERYIEWYNKYLGEYTANGIEDEEPYLSGEIIYNLLWSRNNAVCGKNSSCVR